MTAEELIKVMEKAKELGLSHFKSGDIEFGVLRETKEPDPVAEDLKADELVKPMSLLDALSEDEITYWATSYFDEIQYKKEMQAEKLALEGEKDGN